MITLNEVDAVAVPLALVFLTLAIKAENDDGVSWWGAFGFALALLLLVLSVLWVLVRLVSIAWRV